MGGWSVSVVLQGGHYWASVCLWKVVTEVAFASLLFFFKSTSPIQLSLHLPISFLVFALCVLSLVPLGASGVGTE